jgi:hypothetical protein
MCQISRSLKLINRKDGADPRMCASQLFRSADILVGFGIDSVKEADKNVRAPIAMVSDAGKS